MLMLPVVLSYVCRYGDYPVSPLCLYLGIGNNHPDVLPEFSPLPGQNEFPPMKSAGKVCGSWKVDCYYSRTTPSGMGDIVLKAEHFTATTMVQRREGVASKILDDAEERKLLHEDFQLTT